MVRRGRGLGQSPGEPGEVLRYYLDAEADALSLERYGMDCATRRASMFWAEQRPLRTIGGSTDAGDVLWSGECCKVRSCCAPGPRSFPKAAGDTRRKCQGPGRPRLERDQVELEELMRCWGSA